MRCVVARQVLLKFPFLYSFTVQGKGACIQNSVSSQRLYHADSSLTLSQRLSCNRRFWD